MGLPSLLLLGLLAAAGDGAVAATCGPAFVPQKLSPLAFDFWKARRQQYAMPGVKLLEATLRRRLPCYLRSWEPLRPSTMVEHCNVAVWMPSTLFMPQGLLPSRPNACRTRLAVSSAAPTVSSELCFAAPFTVKVRQGCMIAPLYAACSLRKCNKLY